MYYIVYKTTNLINGKYYIGFHQTEDLNDRYLGSGKYLKKAFKKYGRDNFKKELIANCASSELARKIESFLVKQLIDSVSDNLHYNRAYGGCGAVKGEGNSFYGKVHSQETKSIISELASKRIGVLNPFYGKTHSEDTRQKLSEINKEAYENNKLLHYQYSVLGQFEKWWCTPFGCFFSARFAAEVTGLSRTAIKGRCLNPDKIITKNYYNDVSMVGKTYREIGYYVVEKQQLSSEKL